MKWKHVGNGVDLVTATGVHVKAAPGEEIEFSAADAAGLKGHPEWAPVQVETPKPASTKKEEKT